MGDYFTVKEAVAAASKSAGCEFTQVPGKKIMFHGRKRNGNSVIMCTPQAKLQPKGFGWADITEVQYNLLNSYDEAIVVFRLEGNRLTMCDWDSLKWYLTRDYMFHNTSEGNHWKLYIHKGSIEVVGNKKRIELTSTTREKLLRDLF